MSYTDQLIALARKGQCPGCGPTLISAPLEEVEGLIDSVEFCICCGWFISSYKNAQHTFGNMPSGGMYSFDCAIKHPDHRRAWPKPEPELLKLSDFSIEELHQAIVEQDPSHYYILNDKKCALCNKWAPHRIIEERSDYRDRPVGGALCCHCFESIMGFGSHSGYPYLEKKPIVSEEGQ